MRGIQGLKPLMPLDSLTDVARNDEDRLKRWVQTVGEVRALEALALARTRPHNRTLPELLAEAWLKRRATRYEAQVDLGWARPDFVLFDVVAGVMVWEINGEYWHANTAAHDAARKQRLLHTTARGLPILKVIEVWEKDIYQSETVFEQAIGGLSLRGGA